MTERAATLGESPVDASSQLARLQVFDQKEAHVLSHSLRIGQTCVLGRHSSAQIRVVAEGISRQHAEFELTEAGLHVTDLGSANGVSVQGLTIPTRTSVLVRPAQEVQICGFKVRFRLFGFDDQTANATQRFVARLTEFGTNFKVMGLLGRGGDGSVWAAVDLQNQRRVALKLLHVSRPQDAETLERFRREAEVCMRIDSEHVVKVYDVRMIQGKPVICMELVDGPTALQAIRDLQAPLAIADALSIGVDLAKALVALADAGVVHRDLKPSNVLVAPTGAKLSDFGIAKILDHPSITVPGTGMGTLVYVAPEQALNALDADVRADIYGLGATLYHLLTGWPPYDPHGPAAAVLDEILGPSLPKSMLDYRPELPASLVGLIESMLQRDPELRPSSADVVLEALQAILKTRSPAEDARSEPS